jgi:hypothetical protein
MLLLSPQTHDLIAEIDSDKKSINHVLSQVKWLVYFYVYGLGGVTPEMFSKVDSL